MRDSEIELPPSLPQIRCKSSVIDRVLISSMSFSRPTVYGSVEINTFYVSALAHCTSRDK